MLNNQTVYIGSSDMDFKIPEFFNSDSNCPANFSFKIYQKDCLELSEDFKDSNDLNTTLS